MTVSLLEILAAARAHAAPLAAESAGYLLLAVADHVALAPRAVSAADVELAPDGSVKLRARRGAGESDAVVERGVRELLARALEVSSSVGPALRRASQRPDDVGLAALVRELENALIPVNRSAAKRALSRLHRETERARDAGKLVAALKSEAARATPVVAEAPPPVATKPPVAAEPLLVAADFPDPSPIAAPVVVPVELAVPSPLPPARVAAPAPLPVLTLTPEPRIAVGEPAFTKPEPVVLRKRERAAGRTPQLGTVVTALTLPGEENELTERAPAVEGSVLAPEVAESAPAPEVAESAPAPEVAESAPAPEVDESELEIDVEVELEAALEVAQPLVDPEPSRMPDVVMAMVELHAGIDADDAPTRLRDVVTAVAEPVVVAPPPIVFTEQVDPSVHEALTWKPAPVAPGPEPDFASSVPAAFLIAEPAAEPSPYAPAVLPARSSDVSELLDSFYVSGAAEEQELRSALKEMAGLSLTPMPLPLIDER